jgi:hypothetical protein
MTDRRIALLVLLIIGVLLLALGLGLAWHSHLAGQASPV